MKTVEVFLYMWVLNKIYILENFSYIKNNVISRSKTVQINNRVYMYFSESKCPEDFSSYME